VFSIKTEKQGMWYGNEKKNGEKKKKKREKKKKTNKEIRS
jgi:hypothetical protein